MINELNLQNKLPVTYIFGENAEYNITNTIKLNTLSLMEKINDIRKLVNDFIVNLTLNDIQTLIDEFDENYLPPFLLSLILISIFLAMVLTILNDRIVEDIIYPYLHLIINLM